MTETTSVSEVPEEFIEIAVTQLDYSDANLRAKLEVGGDGGVGGLRASIAQAGVVEPLIVRPVDYDDGDRRYEVVAGNRRLAAAMQAGLETVPCLVRDLDDQQRDEIMLIENLQRVDLAPSEEAVGYGRLAEAGWTIKQLAERIGRSQKHVKGRLKLLELPVDVRVMVDAGELTLEQAGEVARLYEADELDDSQIAETLEEVRSSPWPAERVIERALAEAKFEVALAKAIERLDASNYDYEVIRDYGDRVRVLSEQGYRWVVGPNDRDQFGDSNEVVIDDLAAHDQLECARLVLAADRPGKPKAIRACADPSAHTTKRAEREGALPAADYDQRKEDRSARREERRVERERQEAERRHRAATVAGARKAQAVAVVAAQLVAAASEQDVAEACRTLGVEPRVVEESVWTSDGGKGTRSRKDWFLALRDHLDGADPSGMRFLRAALALALSTSSWSPVVDVGAAKRSLLEQFSDPGEE